jgi:hypothetical protein
MQRIPRAAALLLALAAAGAPAHDPVDVYVPLSRMEVPEPGGRMFGAALGPMALVRLRPTSNQDTTPPDPDTPEIKPALFWQVRVEATPVPLLSLGTQFYGLGWGQQARLMPLQPLLDDTPFSLALTAEYAEADVDFDDSPYVPRTNVHQTVVERAAVVGIKLSRWIMVFGGPFQSDVQYGGEHFRQETTLMGTQTVETNFAGEATLRGGNLGVCWTIGNWGRVVAEVSRTRVSSGGSEETILVPALAFEASFGPVRDPRKWDTGGFPRDPEERVRVVPVEPSGKPSGTDS